MSSAKKCNFTTERIFGEGGSGMTSVSENEHASVQTNFAGQYRATYLVIIAAIPTEYS